MTPDDGGPAFPIPNEHYPNGEIQYGSNGMSLRDWFAGQALAGMLSHPDTKLDFENLAEHMRAPYTIADAMLAARKEKL